MKVYILLIFTVCVISSIKINANNIPDDILDSECFLGINCDERLFSNITDEALKGFKEIGLTIHDFCYLDENPILRKRMIKKIASDIREKGTIYKYYINISCIFNSLQNNYIFVLTISNFNIDDIIYPDILFNIRGDSIEKIIKKLNRKIKKIK